LPPIAGDPSLAERLQRVQTAIAQMNTAVEQGDRGALAGPLQQIATEENAFQRLLDRAESGQ
jgi:hypothetical protein